MATFETFVTATKMEFKNAILCVPTKLEDIVMCAFKHKIVFGKDQNDKFESNECFELNHHQYCEVFRGLFSIVKAYSQKRNTSEARGVFCKKSSTIAYTWEILFNPEIDPSIKLVVENNSKKGYQIILSILDFNDLVLLLGNLILPSLNLNESANLVFRFILSFELDQILKFKKEAYIINVLSERKQHLSLSETEIHRISILVHYYLDIIVATHCIKSLYNTELNLTEKNIELMLSCT